MKENLNFKYLKIVSDAGYESKSTFYIFEDCSGCTYKNNCIKGNNTKIPLEEKTKKHTMNFRMFMWLGKKNVIVENILLAMAHNINKLHSKILFNRAGKHLFDLKITA